MSLNEVIRSIQENNNLSAETRNALHGATSGHPWCVGKTLEQRKQEAVWAVDQKVSRLEIQSINRATA